MAAKSLDSILENFDLDAAGELEGGKSVTIWLPAAYKDKYDVLQKTTRRRFAKQVRAVLKAVIDKAGERTA